MTKTKDKEKILKPTKEELQIKYKETPIRLSADFQQKLYRPEGSSTAYLSGERENLQPRIYYLARLSFRFAKEIKNFTNKQK